MNQIFPFHYRSFPQLPFEPTDQNERNLFMRIKEETLEFIAKYLGDLSKAIITVGFASYFFKDMPLLWRFGCGIAALVFLSMSVILINRKGE